MRSDPRRFRADLERSNRPDAEDLWRSVYQAAWPDVTHVGSKISDLRLQRRGIDRLVITSSRILRVEEKEDTAIKADGLQHDNVLLETISRLEHSKLGFIELDLACDLIAFAFSLEQRAVIIPWQPLRQLWEQHRIAWLRSRRWSVKRTRGDDGAIYTSVAVPVPVDLIRREIRDTIVVNYRAPIAA